MNQIRLNPKKPTVLICSDSASIHTGLARVTREIFTRLAETRKYNIVQHGWFHINPTEEPAWPIISTQHDPKDPNKILTTDRFGQKSLPTVLKDIRPDIVFAFHDPWNLKHFAEYPDKSFRLVSYTCVDSEPMPGDSKTCFEGSDALVLFGEWAKQVVLNDYRFEVDPDKVHVIPHGVDTDTFRPLRDKDERDKTRGSLFDASPAHFVFGTVARNQQRKNVGRLAQLAWHIQYGEYSWCTSCTHCTLHEYDPMLRETRNRPGICQHCGHDELERAEAREDILFYYHGVPAEGWNLEELRDRYQVHKTLKLNPEIKQTSGVSDEELNKIYNACDAFTLPTMAEGFGLPILEAMSAGLPVVVPQYSAYTDWVSERCGAWIQGERILEAGLNCDRIQIYMHSWIEAVMKVVDSRSNGSLELLSDFSRHTALKMGWDDVSKQFDNLFQNLMKTPVEKRFALMTV